MRNLTQHLPLHATPLEREDHCAEHGAFVAKCFIGRVFTGCPACAAHAQAEHDRVDAEAKAAETLAKWSANLEAAGIPPRFWDRKVSTFVVETPEQQAARDFADEYIKTFAQVRKTGRSAIFLGVPGTGKTHLATAIGMAVMRRNGARVRFVTVAKAMRQIKDAWHKASARTEGEAIADLTVPDLLILDEVGVQTGSDFERNMLFDVINTRYERCLPTLFLSNLTKAEVAVYLGERVMDRLREDGGSVISFTWASHRGKAA